MDPSAAEHAAGGGRRSCASALYGLALGTIFGSSALISGTIPSAEEARRIRRRSRPVRGGGLHPAVRHRELRGGLGHPRRRGRPAVRHRGGLAARARGRDARRARCRWPWRAGWPRTTPASCCPSGRRPRGIPPEQRTVAVMESRIVPFLPYGVVNYAVGPHAARLPRDGAGHASVGAAPKVFAYVALGGSSQQPLRARGEGGRGGAGGARGLRRWWWSGGRMTAEAAASA